MLEMGEPVWIMDLARDMIELSGLRPRARTSRSRSSGRRPGEKLHEELFNAYERPQPTPAEKILRAEREPLDPDWVEQIFDEIDLLVLEGDAAGLAARSSELAELRRPAPAAVAGRRRRLPRAPWRRSSLAALDSTTRSSRSGPIAGFAAILGLAVLSLLYFAQAREVKRLREWAGRAPERDAELQQRVAADAGAPRQPPQPRRSPPQPPATPAAGRRAGSAGEPPPRRRPPAGRDARARSPRRPAARRRRARHAGAPRPRPAGAASPRAPRRRPRPGGRPAPGTPRRPPTPAAPRRPPGAGAAAGAAARRRGRRPAAPPRPRRTVAGRRHGPSATVAAARDEPAPRPAVSGRGDRSPRVARASRSSGRPARHRRRAAAAARPSGDTSRAASAPQTTDGATTTRPATATSRRPRDTTVAVLNGTTVTGLAREVADSSSRRASSSGTVDQRGRPGAAGHARRSTRPATAPRRGASPGIIGIAGEPGRADRRRAPGPSPATTPTSS